MKEVRINVVIDSEFKKKVQVKALKENLTLREVVTDLLTKWLNNKV